MVGSKSFILNYRSGQVVVVTDETWRLSLLDADQGTDILQYYRVSYASLDDKIEAMVVREKPQYSPPPAPQIVVIGPTQMRIGEEAIYDVSVTMDDIPCPITIVETMTYLLYDAEGILLLTGNAECVETTACRVSFQTAEFSEGAYRLQLIMRSNRIPLSVFAGIEFKLTP